METLCRCAFFLLALLLFSSRAVSITVDLDTAGQTYDLNSSVHTITIPASPTDDNREGTFYLAQVRENGGSWDDLSRSSTSITQTLNETTTYEYRMEEYEVEYHDGWGYLESPHSYGEIHTLRYSLLPSTPSSVTISPTSSTDGSQSISWTAASYATKYTLQRQINDGSWSTVQDTSTRSKSYTGLTSAKYEYRVRACRVKSFTACSSYRYSSASYVVRAPTTISTTATSNDSDGSFSINWGASSGTVDTYQLQRRAAAYGSSSYGSWATIRTSTSSSARTRNESNLGSGNYQYRVRACISSTCSGYSSTATATVLRVPGSPSGISVPVTDTNGAYVVSWGAATGEFTSYQLQRRSASYGSSSYGNWSNITLPAAALTTRSYDETELTDGNYQYQMRACNSSGCSSYTTSTTAIVLYVPGIPGSITSPLLDPDGAYSISWVAASGVVATYELQRRQSQYPDENYGDWGNDASVATTNYSDTGLVDGNYQYQIRACNSSGCSSYIPSSKVTVLLPPQTPAGLISDPTSPEESDGLFSLTITASSGYVENYYYLEQVSELSVIEQSYPDVTDTAAVEAARKIFSSINSTASGDYVVDLQRPTLSAEANTDYQFKAQACNVSGCSSFTADTSVTIRPPGAPENLLATDIISYDANTRTAVDDDAYFFVNWSAVEIENIYYRLRETLPSGTQVSHEMGALREIERIFLMEDGTYTYEVQACLPLSLDPANPAENCGPYSNPLIVNVDIPSKGFIPHGWSYGYYFLDEQFEGDTPSVYATLDDTQIRWGAALHDRHAAESLDIGAVVQGEVIYSDKPLAIGSVKDGTDMPVPIEFSGIEFVVPLLRNYHYLYVQNLNDYAVGIEYFDGLITTNDTIDANQIKRLGSGNNGVPATVKVLDGQSNILLSHRNSLSYDVYAVPPAKNEVFGVRSNSGLIGIFEDGTNLSQYASDNTSSTSQGVNSGTHLTVGGLGTSQGQGSFVRIIADQPISGIQYADADGSEQTAYLPASSFANRYVLPVDAQYVAMGCLDNDTQIDLYDPTDTLVASTSCNSSGLTPGKAYLGSATNGVQFIKGSRVEANHPIYLIYEEAVNSDEHNLLGAIDGIQLSDPALSSPAFYGEQLDWLAVAGAEYYLVETQEDGEWITLGETTDTAWSLSSLLSGSLIRLSACYSDSICGLISEPQIYDPLVISGYLAQTDAISLSWSDLNSVEVTYEVERSSDGGMTWSNTSIYSGTGVTYTDSSLSSGVYLYRVRACTELCSQWSELTSIAVYDPPEPEAMFSLFDAAVVSWTDLNDAEINYELERSEDAGLTWSSSTIYSGSDNTYTDTGLDPGTYLYRVKACTTACTLWSSSVSVTIYDIDEPTAPSLAAVPSIPNASAETGTISQDLRVDTNGSATWTSSLVLPKGIGGFQPDISLSYSSQSGNGVLGMGWGLNVGSTVSRCRKYFEQDGYYESVNFDNTDSICLNGERLVLVSGTHLTNTAEYRPQLEPSKRIIYYTDTSGGYFEVSKPSGETWLLGQSSNSITADGASSVVYQWHLSARTDSFNNGISYSYTSVAGKPKIIEEISYSGNSINFSYVTRTDGWKHYYQGNEIVEDRLLDSIVIENHNGNSINSYHFDHQYSAVTGRALLEEIERCNGSQAGLCLQPTSFDYEDDVTIGLSSSEIRIPLDSYVNLGADKASDYCDQEFDREYSPLYCYAKDLDVIDTNADGIPEILVTNGTGTTYEYQSFSITPAGFSTVDSISGSGDLFERVHRLDGSSLSVSTYSVKADVVDSNGDGIDEVVFSKNHPGELGNLYMDRDGNGIAEQTSASLGASLESEAVSMSEFPLGTYRDSSLSWCVETASSVIEVADFNGDGLVDRLARVEAWCENELVSDLPQFIGSMYFIAESRVDTNGASTTSALTPIPGSETIKENQRFRSGDINGDGSLYVSELGCSTGSGFDSDCLSDFYNSSIFSFEWADFSDINGDGQDDMLTIDSSSAIKALISDYSGVQSEIQLAQISAWTGVPDDSAKIRMVDLDGDGFPAMVYFDTGDQSIRILHDANTQNKRADVLRVVDNGLGMTATFDYEILSRGARYTRGTGASSLSWGSSPVFDSKGSMYVVDSYTKDVANDLSGNKLTNTIEFDYEGLRYQAGGRGSLGFAKITERNLATNQKTETEYRQDYPFTGQVSSRTQSIMDSLGTYRTLQQMTVNQWQDASLFGGALRHIAPKQSTESSYTLGGSNGDLSGASVLLSTKVTTNVWSSEASYYTNLSSTTVATTDNRTSDVRTESASYLYADEDTTNWYIQRPTEISKTQTLDYAASSIETDTKSQVRTITYNNSARIDYEERGTSSQADQYLKTDYVYDSSGNLINTSQCSSHYAAGCASRAVPTDTDTNLYKVFRRSISNYDAADRVLISTSNGLFTEASYQNYNDLLLPEKVTDAAGMETEFYYDAFGQQYFVRSIDGSYQQAFKYLCDASCPDNAQLYIETSTANAADSRRYFDLAGREVEIQTQLLTGSWSSVRQQFDAQGRLIAQSQPHDSTLGSANWSSYDYDDMGRNWKQTAADGTIRQLSWSGATETTLVTSSYISSYGIPVSSVNYSESSNKTINGFGQLTTSTDANSQDTEYLYGALGLLTQAKNLDDSLVTNTYDSYGRRTVMDDPDKGNISYGYNALDQLVTMTSPGSIVEENFFDAIGRILKTTSGSHTADYVYVGPHLDADVSSEGLIHLYDYDSWGRSVGISYNDGDSTWTTATTYDQYGRVFQEFDASGSGRGSQYAYVNGYNNELKESQDSSKLYFSVTDMDTFGNITGWSYGNGHTGTATYDPLTGFVQRISNGTVLTSLQEHLFEYDGRGNLRARQDGSDNLNQAQLQEVFSYDALNRLTASTFNGVQNLSLSYFDNGNIKTKSDVGAGTDYGYGASHSQCSVTPGSHALTSTGSHKYCYDERGNQTQSYLANGTLERAVTYNDYDKPSIVVSASGQTLFSYDAQLNRFKREDAVGADSRTTYYLGNVEAVLTDTGTEYRRYIGEIAIDVVDTTGESETNYLYRDHLGSITAIADEQGALVERLSYDAFGQRREGISWQSISDVLSAPLMNTVLNITTRGFTDHEHVDHAGLIHMGGRIYDPLVGRFMQADPIVQAPENGQSLNRYTYVFNNPLSYTDPTGYNTVCGHDPRGGTVSCRDEPDRLDEQRNELTQRDSGSVTANADEAATDGVTDGNTAVGDGSVSGGAVDSVTMEEITVTGRRPDDSADRRGGREVAEELYSSAQKGLSATRRKIDVPDGIDDEGKRAILSINLGLNQLAKALNTMGDPELIKIYNEMKLGYYDDTFTLDEKALARAIHHDAGYGESAISFFSPMRGLGRRESIITVFHEFRHLQDANFAMKSSRDGLLGSSAPFEIDAELWAKKLWNNR